MGNDMDCLLPSTEVSVLLDRKQELLPSALLADKKCHWQACLRVMRSLLLESVACTGGLYEHWRHQDHLICLCSPGSVDCIVQIILPPGYLKEVYEEMRAEGAACIADEASSFSPSITAITFIADMKVPLACKLLNPSTDAGASRFWQGRVTFLGVRNVWGGPGHGDPGQAHRQRLSHGCSGDYAPVCSKLFEGGHGVLQHLWRLYSSWCCRHSCAAGKIILSHPKF